MAYVHKVLVALDQLVNVICGGHDDETISAHWERMKYEGKWLGRLGCWCLNKLEANHGHLAVEGDLRRTRIVEQTEIQELKRELGVGSGAPVASSSTGPDPARK